MIEEFCRKFGMPMPAEPTTHDIAFALFRLGLLYEELIEYETSLLLALTATSDQERDQHFEDMIDALGDIIYAAAGTALQHGFDIRHALREIHRANMQKERGTGKRGHSCDVIKPKGWEPPRHKIRNNTPDLFDAVTVADIIPQAPSSCGSPSDGVSDLPLFMWSSKR